MQVFYIDAAAVSVIIQFDEFNLISWRKMFSLPALEKPWKKNRHTLEKK